MGIMKLFSSDFREMKMNVPDKVEMNKIINIDPKKIEWMKSSPDPTKFKILKNEVINGYPIFMVQYEEAKNYEGMKILMYPKHFNTEVIRKRMDPHFFDRGDSPIARFEPTDYGWKLAKRLAMNLFDS